MLHFPAPSTTLPMVHAMVNVAQLKVNSLDICCFTPTGFCARAVISLTRCGPFPVRVDFPEGLKFFVPDTDRCIGVSDAATLLESGLVPDSGRSQAARTGVAGFIEVRRGGCQEAELTFGMRVYSHGLDWLKTVFLGDPSGAGVIAEVRAECEVAGCGLRWKKVQLFKTLRFAGFGGLVGLLHPAGSESRPTLMTRNGRPHRQRPALVKSLDIVSGSSADGIAFRATIAVTNPSRQVSLLLQGPFVLDLFASPTSATGRKIGIASVPRLELPRGGQPAEVQLEGRIHPNAAGSQGADLINALLSPRDASSIPLCARGSTPTDDNWVPRLLSDLEFRADLSLVSRSILEDVALSFVRTPVTSEATFFAPIHVSLRIRNPFDCPILVRRLSATFRLHGFDARSSPAGSLRGAKDAHGGLALFLGGRETVSTAPGDTVDNLDMEPRTLARLLRSSAALQGKDLSKVEEVLRLAEGGGDDACLQPSMLRPAEPNMKAHSEEGWQRTFDGPLTDLVSIVDNVLHKLGTDFDAQIWLLVGGSPQDHPSVEQAGYHLDGVRIVQKAMRVHLGREEAEKISEELAKPIASSVHKALTSSKFKLLLPSSGFGLGLAGGSKEGNAHVIDVELEMVLRSSAVLGTLQATVTFCGGLSLEWGGKRAGKLSLMDTLAISGTGEMNNTIRGTMVVEDHLLLPDSISTLARPASPNASISCNSLSLVVAGIRIAIRGFAAPICLGMLDPVSSTGRSASSHASLQSPGDMDTLYSGCGIP